MFIENYLHPFWIPCYWGQYLQKVGVSYLRWCHPRGTCRFNAWPTAYPRDDAAIDVSTLQPIVARAVHMIKERLVCAYSTGPECVPRRLKRPAEGQ